MTSKRILLSLENADATTRLGVRLGAVVKPGDVLLLDGPVGAGKTHLARALIQSILAVPEDVPSPTFTLVQEYETTHGPLWHTDLYRLGGPDEIEELGLLDAFDTAICLVEWPDRLGPYAPKEALRITLAPQGKGRTATLETQAARWADVLERAA
ncbi:MAG: tRNA (adenosine(37)-N6)-threonylcarbamoyltransferase complex ATPase subunit type 1 TsaE [Pseudomonadota bacterium]